MSSSVSAARKKRMQAMLGVLVILCAGVVLMVDPFGLRAKREEEQRAKDPGLRELVNLAKDDITAFEIKPTASDAFRLSLDNGIWYAGQGGKKYRAAKERVEALLADVPHLMSEGITTDKAEKYTDLQVDEGNAIVLSVYAGGDTPKVRLSVGKSGPAFTTCFVRVDDGKEVFRAAKNIKTLVGLSFKDYRNKKAWDFSVDQATEVSIAAPPAKPDPQAKEASAGTGKEPEATAPAEAPVTGALQTFKLQEGLWKTATGGNANQNAIKEFLKALSEIEANGFVDEVDNNKTALAGLEPCIKVTAGGRIYTLTLGALENSQYYVEDQDKVVYQCGEYNLRSYLELDFASLNLDDTKKDEAAGADGAGGGAATADGVTSDEHEPAEGEQKDEKSEKDE